MKTTYRASFWLGLLGVLLTLSGIFVVAAVFMYASARQDEDVLSFCRVALIVGPLLIGQAIIAKQRITIDEAYKFGYDLGDENGYRRCRKAQRPVVVDLNYSDGKVHGRRRPE